MPRGRPRGNPLPEEPVVTVPPENEPVFAEVDLATLGMRIKTVSERKPVKVMKEGFGPVMDVRLVVTERKELQADLTLEEAQALENSYGEQVWHFHEGKRRWLCLAEGPVEGSDEPIRRRFMLTDELYQKLRG